MPVITARPPRTSEAKDLVKAFLLRAFEEGSADDLRWPDNTTRIEVDGRPYQLAGGYWEMGSGYIYLARPNPHGADSISTETKMAILAAAADYWDLLSDPEVKEAAMKGIVKVMANLWHSVDSSFALATDGEGRPLERFALHNGELAALVGEEWRKPNGELVPSIDAWTQFALEV